MNWFKYRLPNSRKTVYGASHNIIPEIAEGFVIYPFDSRETAEVTIPFDFIPDEAMLQASLLDTLPASTTHDDFIAEVNGIKEALKGSRGKTVAARVISVSSKVDINATFDSLCDAYPDAFVFAFSSSATGTWIGASPELLLSMKGRHISTMALAGTRQASPDGNDPVWDEKNGEEQRMVTEFITETIQMFCEDVRVEKPFTKKAGNVEHICTPITATLPETELTINPSPSTLNSSPFCLDPLLLTLITALSPTPALCGSDRDQSLQLINRYERFDRRYYGGFCGPLSPEGDTDLYVILRCAQCTPSGVSAYAGCGITPLSDPEEEWKETEMKSRTIINQLKTSEE